MSAVAPLSWLGVRAVQPFSGTTESDAYLAAAFAALFGVALIIFLAATCRCCFACCNGESRRSSRGGCCPAPSVAPGSSLALAAVTAVVAAMHALVYVINHIENEPTPDGVNALPDLSRAANASGYVSLPLTALLLALVTPFPPACSRDGRLRWLGILMSITLVLVAGIAPGVVMAYFDPSFYPDSPPDNVLNPSLVNFCTYQGVTVKVPLYWEASMAVALAAAVLGLAITLLSLCCGCSSRPASRSIVLVLAGLGGAAAMAAYPLQQLSFTAKILCTNVQPGPSDDPTKPLRVAWYGSYDIPMLAGCTLVLLSFMLRWCAWGADARQDGARAGVSGGEDITLLVVNPVGAAPLLAGGYGSPAPNSYVTAGDGRSGGAAGVYSWK